MSVIVKFPVSVKNFHRLIIQLIDGIPTAISELPFFAPFGMLFILRYRLQVIKLGVTALYESERKIYSDMQAVLNNDNKKNLFE